MRKQRGRDSGLVEVSKPKNLGTSQFNGARISRMPNGDIEVSTGEEGPRIPKEGDFDENLAEYLSASQRQNIAQELLEQFAADKESRKDWEMREEVAVDMLGIQRASTGPDELKKLQFPVDKGHEVTHPLIAEAATQFNARAIAEIFPPEGPVKATVLGNYRTQKMMDQAERVQMFMNYYLTEVDREYFDDVDSMLFYLSLAGSAFKKVAIDVRTGLPISRYVKAANFIVPYSARSLTTAARFHHNYTMVESDFEKAVALEYYLDTGIVTPGLGGEATNKAEDRADYRTPSMPREEVVYDIVESHALYSLPLKYKRNRNDRDQIRPYVFHIDRENTEITRISRGWAEKDTSYRRKPGFVHYKFLPGLGFYGFGYPHLIGSLGRAASGAVNSLLDAATAANFQGGFKTKSGRGMGDVELEHGVYKEVDADYEDLSKTFFNPPFKGPEPAMFQLLGALVESGRRFASIQDSQVGGGSNQGPVGTTVALIEEGSRVYTAIHKRLHKAARDEFSILADLIHDYMPSQYPFETKGEEKTLLRTDFDGRVDIAPVSDPNIFSSTQRIAIMQNVIALQKQDPDLYGRKQRIEAHRAFYKALRVPDWETYAPQEKRPNYQDPVAENMLMLTGQAVKAFYHQLDEVHIQVHQNFLQIQQPMMDPKEFAQLQATVSAHIREHQANAYRKQFERQLGIPLPPVNTDADDESEDLPPDLEAAISVALAQHLLPPPPTPEEIAAGQEVMDEKARKDAETMAKIERETKAWENDQRLQEQTHGVTLRRTEELHQQDMAIKDENAAADIIRGRSELAAGILRKNVETEVGLTAKERAARQDLEHKERRGQQELQHGERKVGQVLDHTERKTGQQLEHGSRKANLELGTRAAGAAQDLQHKEKKSASELSAAQKKHGVEMSNRNLAAAQQRSEVRNKGRQERAQTDQVHKQRLRQTDEQHQQGVKQKDEGFKLDLRHREQSNAQDVTARKQKADLDAKIAQKRGLGAKQGAAKKKAKKSKE